jgi:hypothetical protein
VCGALTAYEDDRIRKEMADRYLRIEKAAREFAEAVKHSDLDTTPYWWYPDDAIGALLSRMRPELAEGMICWVNPDSEPRDCVLTPVGYADDGSPNLYRYFADSLVEFFERLLPVSSPTVSTIVEVIAEGADIRAKETMAEPRILRKLKSNNPEKYDPRRVAFIRSMAEYFVCKFGKVLLRTLANLSAVALEDETIKVETVRSALKGWEIPVINEEDSPL